MKAIASRCGPSSQRGHSHLVYLLVPAILFSIAALWELKGTKPQTMVKEEEARLRIAPAEGAFAEQAAKSIDGLLGIELIGHPDKDSVVTIYSDDPNWKDRQVAIGAKKEGALRLPPGKYSVKITFMDPDTITISGSTWMPLVLRQGSADSVLDLHIGRMSRVPFPIREASRL